MLATTNATSTREVSKKVSKPIEVLLYPKLANKNTRKHIPQASGSGSKPGAIPAQEMTAFEKAMMDFMINQEKKTEERERNQAISMRIVKNKLF